jgi:hypothetical protein
MLPELGRRAELGENAGIAAGTPGDTYLAPVLDQAKTQGSPPMFRHQRAQVGFDLHGICMPCETEELAHSKDMGIDRQSG